MSAFILIACQLIWYEQVGICGEHGGDPASIQFFNKAGLDYISCSPSRVPIAKMAAAQAHIEDITRKYLWNAHIPA